VGILLETGYSRLSR